MATPGFNFKFKGFLIRLASQLSPEQVKKLGFIYLDTEAVQGIKDDTDLMERITQRQRIRDCQEDLNQLIESLENIGRTDLKEMVTGYIEKICPPVKLFERPPSLEPVVQDTVSSSTMHMAIPEEKGGDYDRSTVTGFEGFRSLKRRDSGNYEVVAKKKRRTMETTEEETKDLEVAALHVTCDSTSDGSGSGEDDSCCGGDCEASEEDKKFMRRAQEVARNSPDPQTKVGVVIVDPVTGEIVAEGWNRMPDGCEDCFKWIIDKEKESFECGKHYYVVYGVRAAIFNGLQKGADLRGCILYTTLYPSNVCAQCIRDVGIAEVVYVSDKFHHAKFMVAARRIMEGIKCRQMRLS